MAYIDRDKLIDKLEELQFNAPVMTPVMKIYNVIELVEDQPNEDVVEVVKCKDCKYIKYLKHAEVFSCMFWNTHRTYEDCFCSYGKRKEVEE